jgi:hypothetical protein
VGRCGTKKIFYDWEGRGDQGVMLSEKLGYIAEMSLVGMLDKREICAEWYGRKLQRVGLCGNVGHSRELY